MTSSSFLALQKIVALLGGAQGLPNRELRVLEIALEGMKVPRERRQEAVQNVIQAARDKVLARRPRQGVEHANP